MNVTDTQQRRNYGFAIGLLTGTFVGAGLAVYFAPRLAAELGQRVSQSAKGLAQRASEQFEQTSDRVGEAIDEISRTGQNVRDDVAEPALALAVSDFRHHADDTLLQRRLIELVV